jgi:SAM-dependent methyltransferase
MTHTTTPRHYYQQWYSRNTPISYRDHTPWRVYAHALQRCIAALQAEQPRGLEVGCGGGHLQHLLSRYVGVDLAASVRRFMVRPFAAASATALPFADASFDIVWSIWTLEHLADPEGMLAEMQRVTRPGGYIFLGAAWNVPDWATRGYHVLPWRPATLPHVLLRLSVYPRRWFRPPGFRINRLLMLLHFYATGKQHRLVYRFLLPSYETYHDTDADACITLDPASVILWFRARGVACVSHPTGYALITARLTEPFIFRVVPGAATG